MEIRPRFSTRTDGLKEGQTDTTTLSHFSQVCERVYKLASLHTLSCKSSTLSGQTRPLGLLWSQAKGLMLEAAKKAPRSGQHQDRNR